MLNVQQKSANPGSAKLPYTYLTGGKYWRFRHTALGDIPLPGAMGDDVFHIRYGELLSKALANASAVEGPGELSLDYLMDRWMESADFEALKEGTQRWYRMARLAIGDLLAEPYALISRRMVKARRDACRSTPRKAQYIVEVIRACYGWAQQEEFVEDGVNPAVGLKRLKHQAESYSAWSDEELDLFLRHAEPDLASLVILQLFTGQRGIDVVKYDWSKVHGSTVRVRQEKTGTEIEIHCHPRLRACLDELRAAGTGEGPVVCKPDGKPYSTNEYRRMMRETIARIPNMPRRVPHGLRYTAAAMLEEAGCTVAQIASILGHSTYAMAIKYISQRRAAKEAIVMLNEFQSRQRAISYRNGKAHPSAE